MSKTILVADDDPQIVSMLMQLLESTGYVVLTAPDGRGAVDACRKHAVDLLLTDLIMPEQEGVETIKMLRKEFPSLKIIAMSGVGGGKYLDLAGMLGADAVLRKPFEPRQLQAKITKLIGE